MAARTAKKSPTPKKTASKKKTARKAKPSPKRATAAKKPKPSVIAEVNAVGQDISRFLRPVTIASLLAEAKARPANEPALTLNRGDLVADGGEGKSASEDVADLEKRGYRINAHTVKRIELLTNELTPHVVAGDEARAAAKQRTEKADASRVRLLQIRSELAAIGEAGGVPSDWFKLSLRKSDRINPVVQRLSEILYLARKQLKHLPDRDRVLALLDEGDALVQNHLDLRTERSELRGQGGASTQLVDQLTRMLWEVLQYVSKIGIAAYPEDPMRAARYRLDHVYAKRAGDPEEEEPVEPK